MPESKFNLPYRITSLQAPDAAAMIQKNFEALAAYSDGKIGSLSAVDAVEQIAHGEEAYAGTVYYRSAGAPDNNPEPTGITNVQAPNGTMLTTLGWTYDQGEIPADFLMLYKEWSATEDPGIPEPTDPAIALSPSEGPTSFTFEGLNPSYKWSFAIAAGRKTESGLEIGPLQSIESWQNVTIGTPNFAGTVGGTSATLVSGATSNFNGRNDRKGTPPANPTIPVDGSSIDHVLNDDGSADLSFEWQFSGLGDSGDIDGFIVYVRQGTTSTPYLMGTHPNEEQVTYLPAAVRAHIVRGVRADGYYTFGVQAYRDVDQDIDSDGRIYSALVQPSRAEENPYHPSSTVEFKGDITGTVGGTPADMVAKVIGCGDGSDGVLSTSTDVIFPVSMDGDAIIKEYESLVVNAGDLLTPENPCRGLFILVRGDCTVNGTISVDDKAAAIGSGWPGGTSAQLTINSPITSEFAFTLIPLAGAGGRGGDGAGGYTSIGSGASLHVRGGRGGRGALNSAYGGSSGGGGGGGAARTRYEYGTFYWLPGGDGGGGTGNGGAGGEGGDSTLPPSDGRDGGFGRGGGILALVVGGKLTIGPTGKITASATVPGADGQDGTKSGVYRGGGGGGEGGLGGGVIVLAHKGGLVNQGTLLVNGSPGGSGGRSSGLDGQPGQPGAIKIVQL